MAYIGAARARDLAVNVILPFLDALDRVNSSDTPQPDSPSLTLYRKFPKLQPNEICREMAEQLLEADWSGTVNSARRQQGLIHLHRQLTG